MDPALSFVVAARNDTYGGDFLGRMQLFVNALLAQWKTHRLDAELIVVEWNPPADHPRLTEAVRWPAGVPARRVRIIEVPAAYHQRFTNAQKMPIFEYIAKNVGIRRARGKFILSTNPDILFSDSLMHLLAARSLKDACFYRANRHDVAEPVPAALPLSGQLDFCRRHAFRVHAAGGTAPFPRRRSARAFFARNRYRLSPRWFLGELKRRTLHPFRRFAGQPPTPPRVHVHASGDFLLMSADRWREFRGYPQLTTHSHIDSYMMYQVGLSGMRQRILRGPIYHQEHDRSEQVARPWTVLSEIPELRQMLESGRPAPANGADWGLGDSALRETEVGSSIGPAQLAAAAAG